MTTHWRSRPDRSESRRGPAHRKVSIAACSALAASGLSFATATAWEVEMATRPSCPPGYVRLLDLDPVARLISGMLAVVSVVVLLASLRYGRRRLLTTIALVLLVLALAGSTLSTMALVYDHSRSSSNCWTF